MDKIWSFLFVSSLFITIVISISDCCPLSSKMTTCTPICKDDLECRGRKCCPNICNTKSCVPDHLRDYSYNTYDGYKNKYSKSATGSYCGNVKCNSYEKCEMDKATKRQRCVPR